MSLPPAGLPQDDGPGRTRPVEFATGYEPPSGARRPLVSTLVLVSILVLGLVLLFPPINAAREAGRRTQCSCNFRQLGIAIHNYHDATNQLPPLATDEGHWSWVTLLLPHMEGQATITQIELWKSADTDKHVSVVRQFQMASLLCPT